MITYSGASLNFIEDWLDHITSVSPVDGSATATSLSWSVTAQPDDSNDTTVATLVLQGDFSGTDPASQQVSSISAYDSNNNLLFTLGELQLSLAKLQWLAARDDLEDLLKVAQHGSGSILYQGSDDDDKYNGSKGDDAFSGGAGDDRASGGNGNDDLYGDDGMDRLFGGNGNDLLSGGVDDDSLNAGNGNDTLEGGDGNDKLAGSGGNDSLFGGLGDDVLNGDGGNDTLWGDEGNDQLNGQGGNDVINGGSGNDILRGQGGNDRLDGGEGQDTLYGDGGNDVYVIANSDAADTIVRFATGKDKIEISGAAFGITDTANLSFAMGTDGKGHLYYDADGEGDGVAIEIVGVQQGTVNVASDVIVV